MQVQIDGGIAAFAANTPDDSNIVVAVMDDVGTIVPGTGGFSNPAFAAGGTGRSPTLFTASPTSPAFEVGRIYNIVAEVWQGVLPSTFLAFAFQVVAAGSSVLTGVGPYAVDHNGGIGAGGVAATVDTSGGTTYVAWNTDILKYTSDGSTGVAGLAIRAYVKSDYDATTGAGFVGQTVTKADGTWEAPLMMASGDYYVIADNPNDPYVAKKVSVRVP